MRFELTEALVDQLLFAMEDQNQDLVLDLDSGLVVDAGDVDSGGTTAERIPLPQWDSSDGFRLMERFAAGLRNPPVREELSQALDRGKGVFRAFKDVLTRHPEVERLWHLYKEREMRRVILTWYNALREEWGLDRLGDEPEETTDLVLEDFTFRAGTPEDAAAAGDLHRICVREYRQSSLPGEVWTERDARRLFPGDLSLVAETGRGDFAGCIAAVREDALLRISVLEVNPEYRGLGIGEELLAELLAALDPRLTPRVLLDLPTTAESFSRVLNREGFQPYETRYCLTVPNRKNPAEG